MSNKIKLILATGYNVKAEHPTELGILHGEEFIEEVSLSMKQAQELLQSEVVNKLDYREAIKFCKKYSK